MLDMTQYTKKADNVITVNNVRFMVTDEVALQIMALIEGTAQKPAEQVSGKAAPAPKAPAPVKNLNKVEVKDSGEKKIADAHSSALTKALKSLPSVITAAEISAVYDSWEQKGWQWQNGRPSTKDVAVHWTTVNGVVTGYCDGGRPVFVSRGLNEACKAHLRAAGFHYNANKKGWVVK